MFWDDDAQLVEELREYGYEPLPGGVEQHTFEERLVSHARFQAAYIRRRRTLNRRELGCTCDAPLT